MDTILTPDTIARAKQLGIGQSFGIATPQQAVQANATAQKLGVTNNAVQSGGIITAQQQSVINSTLPRGTQFPVGAGTATAGKITPAPAPQPYATTPAPAAPTVYHLPSGATADAQGNILTPASRFSIDTTGGVPSDALTSTGSYGNLSDARNQYQQYVQQLSQAQQYSPAYQQALQASQNAKLGAQQLQSDYYTNPEFPGATLDQANIALQRGQALNSLQQTSANNALQLQELVRQGNIAGAQALVSATKPETVSPGSSLVSPSSGDALYGGAGAYSDYQAQQTYFNFAQQYPDAQIPAYNPQLTAQQNLQVAQQAAASSPSFQSRNLVQVALPGGGISFVNRNQLHTNADGSYTFVSSGDAATQSAAKSTIADLTKQRADTQSAITTADANFPLLLDAAKKAGVNNNAPLVNQIAQAVARKTIPSDALASLNTLVPSLQTEYSRIIARGATPDDQTRRSAQAIVDGTYSLSQLQAVYNTVSKEGANVIKGFDTEIVHQQSLLGGTSTGGKIDVSQYSF